MTQISSSTVIEAKALLAQDAFIQNCISSSLFALVVFDHIINIHEEIAYLWCWKFSPVTLFLVITKYGALAYVGLAAAGVFVVVEETCNYVARSNQALLLLLMVMFGGMFGRYHLLALSDETKAGSTLRAYALSRNGLLTLIVAILGTGQVAINIYLIANSAILTTSAQCLVFLRSSSELQNQLSIVARLSTALADVVVLIVTLRSTAHGMKHAVRTNMRTPIVLTLLRDGALYFVAALLMNLTQIALYQVLHELYLAPFICVVTSILLSRLFLDLREAVGGNNHATTYTQGSRVPILSSDPPTSVENTESSELEDGINLMELARRGLARQARYRDMSGA